MIQNFPTGLPAPEILTPFVSGVEFVGGVLLLVGLLTRFAAVPLMIVMVVAIVSAKAGDIDSLETLLGFEEVSYFVMFGWLAIAGPGPVSLDHFILKATGRKRRRTTARSSAKRQCVPDAHLVRVEGRRRR